ncbi:MBL fold metallo-hydrolase [Bdellovibrio svalbardensis]|uniref:MBL fold metallo-hydrolase n=1 Tax=Bdellovibrio svalbardensis TaxID=2972972 RepID=A0ABT6DI53_9BACT|nr:MBL fold metallo-hydrolase [Bdellovibrio svalbardensis]MDG0816167.1 MBL fold metallo-hydrolase [Bdellovibrio svalbardensis]
MSVKAGESWSYQKYKFHGLSLSGIRTAIAMPELSLSFDVAQGYPYLLNLKNFFISHGHLDHAAGVPYIISQKAMTSQEAGKFYMPKSLVEPLDQIMKIWEKIEGHQYKYEFIGVEADDEIYLNAQTYVKVFPTTHRVDSFGYTVFEIHKKLKAELQGLSQDEIVDLKRQGHEVNELQHIPVVSFTGDTQIEFLNSRPWVRDSKILLMEATYLDSRKTIEAARQWGHTHLDEIIPRLQDIKSEKIVLIHLSSRYSDTEVKKIIQQRIPAEYQDRIEVFPGR